MVIKIPKMDVLIVGSGGRERALAWKIRQSPLVGTIYVAPGGAGYGGIADACDVSVTNISGLAQWAKSQRIGLTIVGPDRPLVEGIVDEFTRHRLRIVGPTSRAAFWTEGSKAAFKKVLRTAAIPTAAYDIAHSVEEARYFIRKTRVPPYVVKADGLCEGKGVRLCMTISEADAAIDELRAAYPEATAKFVIEEYLSGDECSFIALVNARGHVLPLRITRDHKRLFDGDVNPNPNTGGMAAYGPLRAVERQWGQVIAGMTRRIVRSLQAVGVYYTGVIYLGMMITADGPKVLECNARFGDPECQPLMVAMKSDLVPCLYGTTTSDDTLWMLPRPEWHDGVAVCLVASAEGYALRESVRRGDPISGMAEAEALGAKVFLARARKSLDGKGIVTDGGRVLGVTMLGSAETIVERVYEAMSLIQFSGMYYRRDIRLRDVV